MKGLFLDDERNPSDVTWVNYPDNIDWDIVRNREEFNNKAVWVEYDLISFDHDIQDFDEGGRENTGLVCLKDLCNMMMDAPYRSGIPDVAFHTKNNIGLDNMQCYWINFMACFHEQESAQNNYGVPTEE